MNKIHDDWAIISSSVVKNDQQWNKDSNFDYQISLNKNVFWNSNNFSNSSRILSTDMDRNRMPASPKEEKIVFF